MFDRLEPIGAERLDKQVAHVVRTLMEIHRDPEKRSTPFTMDEARLWLGEDANVRASEASAAAAPPRTVAAAAPLMDWRFMKAIGRAMAEASNREAVPA